MSNWMDAKNSNNDDSPEAWRFALHRPETHFSIESSPISGLKCGAGMMRFLDEHDYPRIIEK